jgi:hypothetical protein
VPHCAKSRSSCGDRRAAGTAPAELLGASVGKSPSDDMTRALRRHRAVYVAEALRRIAELHAVERTILDRAADVRRHVRNASARPLLVMMKFWLETELGRAMPCPVSGMTHLLGCIYYDFIIDVVTAHHSERSRRYRSCAPVWIQKFLDRPRLSDAKE